MSDASSMKIPKPFNGRSLIEFNIHRRELLAYAEFKRIAHCLDPEWRVSPVPAAAVQNNNHLHPGVPDHNNAGAIRAWKIQTELYRIEKSDNENALRQFNYLTAVRKAEVEANGEAISLIKRCFKDSVFRRNENFTNASEKLTAIAAMFAGTHETTMGTEWISLWNNLTLEKDAPVKEIETFVSRVAELVREHVAMFDHEIEKKGLLALLFSKFQLYSPQQDEFASLKLKMSDKTGPGFYPPLVNGEPGPTHFAQAVENFMDFVQDLCARMLSKKQMEEANARSRNRPVAANATDESKKTKTCSFHGKCLHDSSECNKLKAQQKSGGSSKDAKKDKTNQVNKGKAGKTGKQCSTCKKGIHALKDCPKVKEVFKGMAKQASSDGDTAMDTTDSDETPASTGNASANAAKPVYNLSSIIHDLDVEWLPFFESNKAIANELPLALVARDVRTILDSGASKWMSASSKAFSKLTLVPGGCGHVSLADSEKTIPIQGHGTDDNISFGTENVYYTSKANGFKYMIGKRCGDLYYLHTSNASPKSNDALMSSGSVSTAPIPLNEEVDIDMERVRITEPENQVD
ncbi:hypothetical protein HDU77_000852, partial [Chytriomyces hyalinus]